MARSSSYTYDAQTGKWTKSASTKKSSSSSSKTSNSSSSKSSTSSSKSSGNTTTSSSSSSTKKSSKGNVQKKYNTIELNTLSGTLNFIVNESTIKLKAGDTVKLQGLGKYLNGKYYIQDITRQISSSGYSHSATLIKTDFGKYLKTSTKTTKKKSKTATAKLKTVEFKTEKFTDPLLTSADASRTYTVTKGENSWSIAKQIYGDGSLYTRLIDTSTGEVADPKKNFIGQVLNIT